jgi:hypothetical protein
VGDISGREQSLYGHGLRSWRGTIQSSAQISSESWRHLSLGIGVLDLLHLDDFFLVQYFDGVETSVVPGSHKMNAVPAARKTAGRYALADFQIERT